MSAGVGVWGPKPYFTVSCLKPSLNVNQTVYNEKLWVFLKRFVLFFSQVSTCTCSCTFGILTMSNDKIDLSIGVGSRTLSRPLEYDLKQLTLCSWFK